MMLETGKPHGKLPSWLTRDGEGQAIIKPDAQKTIESMIELFLTNDEDDNAQGFKKLDHRFTSPAR